MLTTFFLLGTVALALPPQIQDDTDIPLSTPKLEEAPIINGMDATADDYPMTGGMLITGEIWGYPMNMFVCSSTLIAPDAVILAAHCLDMDTLAFGMEIDNLHVYWTRQADLSEWDGTNENPVLPADAIEAVDWVIHEEFDIQSMQLGLGHNKDIAMLFLSEPVLDIKPAYLPTVDENQEIQMGDLVSVVGWGQQIATGQQQSPPPGSYSYKQQGDSFISEIMAFEFKVGEEQDDVRKCHGDSGGPTFWESNDGMRLIGVTSHAYDNTDCFETGGVDTRIGYYFDWIEEQMVSRCESGIRTWCDVPGILEPMYFEKLEAEEEEEEKAGLFGCSSTPGNILDYWMIAGVAGLVMIRRRK